MADRDRKLIVDMRWDETSGVDHPANEEEGWIVMKSADADSPDLEDLIKAEEEFAKAFDVLVTALSGADFSSAPTEVQDAAKTLLGWLQEFGYGYGAADNPAAKPDYPAPKPGYPTPRAGAMRALWDKVRERLFGKARENEAEEALDKALLEQWPEFCRDVAAIAHSDEGAEVKAVKLADRVAALKAKTEPTKEE